MGGNANADDFGAPQNLLLAFGMASNVWLAYGLLFAIGVAQGIAMVTMSIALLEAAGTAMRGRIMGVRMLAVYGLPIGLIASGQLVDRLGYHGMVLLYCGVGALATVGLLAGVMVVAAGALRLPRGAALRTGGPGAEEFPDFTAFWICEPEADARTIIKKLESRQTA